MPCPGEYPHMLCGDAETMVSLKCSLGNCLPGSVTAQSPALDHADITLHQCPAWDTGWGMLTQEPSPFQTAAAQAKALGG